APAVKREGGWGGGGGNGEKGEDTGAGAFTLRLGMWGAKGEKNVEHLAGGEGYNLGFGGFIGILCKNSVGGDGGGVFRVGANRSKGWRIVERSGRFDVE